MNFLKKTIFLSNNEKNKSMATLTLENRNSNIFGIIKVYNNNLNGDYVLGIKSDDRVIKQNVKLNNNIYNFIITDKINLNNTLGCVLLKVDNTNIEPILWGSEKSENYKGKIINTLRESISKLASNKSSKTTSSTNNTYNNQVQNNIANENIKSHQNESHLSHELKSDISVISEPNRRFENVSLQIDNIIKEELEELIPSSIHSQNYSEDYRNFNIGEAYAPFRHTSETYTTIQSTPEVYAQISLEEELVAKQNVDEIAIASNTAHLFESSDEEIEETIDNNLHMIENGKHKFYDLIADQLKELFDRYPREENLCKLIDNSDWVKIDTGIDNKFHIVGIIMHNNDIKYICYGVPGNYNIEPPIEMRDYSQWLPTDVNDPYNTGYWVLYQDADTGENIMLN